MSPNYGFTITAHLLAKVEPGTFISGQAFECGHFRPIIPMKPRVQMKEGEERDFVPVWATKEEALAMVGRFKTSAAAENYGFKAVDIKASIEGGGPMTRGTGLFRGVGGWTVPEPVRMMPTRSVAERD